METQRVTYTQDFKMLCCCLPLDPKIPALQRSSVRAGLWRSSGGGSPGDVPELWEQGITLLPLLFKATVFPQTRGAGLSVCVLFIFSNNNGTRANSPMKHFIYFILLFFHTEAIPPLPNPSAKLEILVHHFPPKDGFVLLNSLCPTDFPFLLF